MMINTPLLSISDQYLKVWPESHKQVLHFV